MSRVEVPGQPWLCSRTAGRVSGGLHLPTLVSQTSNYSMALMTEPLRQTRHLRPVRFKLSTPQVFRFITVMTA